MVEHAAHVAKKWTKWERKKQRPCPKRKFGENLMPFGTKTNFKHDATIDLSIQLEPEWKNAILIN